MCQYPAHTLLRDSHPFVYITCTKHNRESLCIDRRLSISVLRFPYLTIFHYLPRLIVRISACRCGALACSSMCWRVVAWFAHGYNIRTVPIVCLTYGLVPHPSLAWTVYVSTTASSAFRTIWQTVTAFRKTFLVSRQRALLFSQMEVAQHSGYTTCCNMQSDPPQVD